MTDFIVGPNEDVWANTGVQVLMSSVIALTMYFIQEVLAEPVLARWIATYPKKSNRDDYKFPAHVCNLAMHAPVAFVTAYIVWAENWYNEPAKIWENFPDQPQPAIYYMIYFYCNGYHLQRLIRLLVKPGNDWIEMGTHHVLTVFLLSTSIYMNYIRIGIVVLMINDVSDIFVYSAKLASVLEWGKIQALVTFPLMTSTWAYFRIHQFTSKVIPMAKLHPENCISCEMCVNAMWMLVALNVFWFCLFIRMAYRLVFKGQTRDWSDDPKAHQQQANLANNGSGNGGSEKKKKKKNSPQRDSPLMCPPSPIS